MCACMLYIVPKTCWLHLASIHIRFVTLNQMLAYNAKSEVSFYWLHIYYRTSPDGSVGKESACNAGDTGDTGSIPGSGRSPRVGNGKPLKYSCLENSMDRGAWRVTVLEVAESKTRLSNKTHTHTHWLRCSTIWSLDRSSKFGE